MRLSAASYTDFMAKEVTLRRSLPARRRWVFEKNTMGFPGALRERIPDHATSIGRVLNYQRSTR
jgi:hypothetical protein